MNQSTVATCHLVIEPTPVEDDLLAIVNLWIFFGIIFQNVLEVALRYSSHFTMEMTQWMGPSRLWYPLRFPLPAGGGAGAVQRVRDSLSHHGFGYVKGDGEESETRGGFGMSRKAKSFEKSFSGFIKQAEALKAPEKPKAKSASRVKRHIAFQPSFNF